LDLAELEIRLRLRAALPDPVHLDTAVHLRGVRRAVRLIKSRHRDRRIRRITGRDYRRTRAESRLLRRHRQHLRPELLRDHKAAGPARTHLLSRRGLAIKLLVHQALVVRVETHGVQELASRLKLPLRLRTTRRETLALSNRRPRSVEMRFERFQLLSSLDVLGQLLDLGLLSV